MPCVYAAADPNNIGTDTKLDGLSASGFAVSQDDAVANATYLNSTIPSGNQQDQGMIENTGSGCTSDNTKDDLFHVRFSGTEFEYNDTKTAAIKNDLECQFVCNMDTSCLMAKWIPSTLTCQFTDQRSIVYLDDTATCENDGSTYYIRQGTTTSDTDELCIQTNLNSCQETSS